MQGSLRWRIPLVLVVALVGLAYLLPSLPSLREGGLGRLLPGHGIGLGLDLKGGIHLTLEVDTKRAHENALAQMGRDIRTMARDKDVMLLKPETLPGGKLTFQLLTPEKQGALDELLRRSFGGLEVESRQPGEEGKTRYTLAMTPKHKAELTELTVDQAVKTIRNRIDQFGVAEPDIRKQAGGRVQVQLPGLSDPERAINLISQAAHLEFKIVDDAGDPAKAAVSGREVLVMRRSGPTPGGQAQGAEQPLVVMKEAVLTGEAITDATVNYDQFNQPYVSLTFSPRGAQDFERITGENLKKRMAIVLDGQVYSAPVIQDRIAGGRAQITGRFSVAEARDLAVVLRAGALPAPVKVIEQRTVGPSLGQESIDKGLLSAVLGMAVVSAFMVIYYNLSGAFAVVALLLNLVLILGGLAAFGATLTLPGIAGIILTIGMSVDANVLIFERIREDLRLGLTPLAAIEQGFSRASITILDANVTTLIAALVLYEFGTGPVRGFAVTLTLGIVASMFTAIFVTRVLFDIYAQGRRQSAGLSI